MQSSDRRNSTEHASNELQRTSYSIVYGVRVETLASNESLEIHAEFPTLVLHDHVYDQI
jgi:hypothetical protein